MNNSERAFTLIELLAVIIILGLLMLIAIPSVTTYINNSRREAYIDTAREYIMGATNLVNSGALDIYDPSVTYYIPSTCIPLETGGTSPYGGKFDPAYIVVTYDNDSYNYYWLSRDAQSMGINKVTSSNKLKADLIKSGVTKDDVKAKYGVDGRKTIIEFTEDCSSNKDPVDASSSISGDTGEDIVQYPDDKTKDTVVAGDLVCIGEECFYVVKHDGNNLVLLARYNLKVGSIRQNWTNIGEYSSSDTGYGIQCSECKGYNSSQTTQSGFVSFSDSSYWSSSVSSYPANVYGDGSNIKPYVDNYKSYIERILGRSIQARLLYLSEAVELGCSTGASYTDATCSSAKPFINETAFWMGTASSYAYVWGNGAYGSWPFGPYRYTDNTDFGVRPVIII